METQAILFRPIGFNPSRKDISDADCRKEHIAWLKKNPNPIQKMNYMTIGGFGLSAVGALVALFSEKAGKIFGAILTIVGLGAVGGGIWGNGSLESERDEALVTPVKPTDKKKTKDNELSKFSIDDLINIVTNKDSDKANTAKKRAKAVVELGNRGLHEVKKSLVALASCFKRKDESKQVKNAVKLTLRKVADDALRELLGDTADQNGTVGEAKRVLREILKIKT